MRLLGSLLVLCSLVACGDEAPPRSEETTAAATRQVRFLQPPATSPTKLDSASGKTSTTVHVPAKKKDETMAKATFGNGCFWCTEAVFQQLKGVSSVTSGYSGGSTDEPTYEAVCSGATGHAEVIHVTYDPAVISYEQLLEVFFKTHDPTTLNRQGADVGTQYRSAIFYHDPDQRDVAERVKKHLDEAGVWPDPIVTEITAFERFWPAEAKHQDFYARTPGNRYCQVTIPPKLEKLQKTFKELIKREK